MIELDEYIKAFGALPDGVSAAEVNAERIDETSIRVKNGDIDSSEAYTRTKLYVRAWAERTGSAYTEKLDGDAAEMINRAAENARYATADAPEPMNGAEANGLERFAERDEGPADVEAMLKLGAAVGRAALVHPEIEITELAVNERTREQRTANSSGLDAQSSTHCAAALLGVRLPRKAGFAEGQAQISAKTLDGIQPAALVEKAYAAANAADGGGLGRIKLKAGRYDAVLSGEVMRNIFMTAWQTLSSEAMQKGASPFKNEGETVGSAAFGVVNAPSHPLVGQSFVFDSEGTPVPRTEVVRGGKLVSPLYTRVSAQTAGRKTTGSAGRVARMTGDVPIAITTLPALIYIEQGQDAKDALIARMGTGLHITYSLDLYHSVNTATGEFSVPCGGVYYENGRPVGAVSEVTMAGDIRTLWTAIEAVADDLDFDDFYFKTYCVGSPSALVRAMIFAS